jgi:hypothetical protein
MHNNYTLTALDELSPSQIAGLPAGTLAELQDEADAAVELAKKRLAALDAGLDQRYGTMAQELRLKDGKDTGIVRLSDGGCEVIAETKKSVTWDQPKLAEVTERIRAAGDDPAVYVVAKTTLTVREASYKDWPDSIKAEFEPARTVRAGKPSYRIEREPARKAVA